MQIIIWQLSFVSFFTLYKYFTLLFPIFLSSLRFNLIFPLFFHSHFVTPSLPHFIPPPRPMKLLGRGGGGSLSRLSIFWIWYFCYYL
jgi:hypothetical protein